MDTTIEYCIRNVYGKELAYPVNRQAKLLTELTNTKTLTIRDLVTAQEMGFLVKLVPDPRSGNAELV